MMSSSLPQVAILVLNYNKPHETVECLQSLNQISYPNKTITVIDNHSTDDSLSVIENHLKKNKISYTLFLKVTDFLESNHGDQSITIVRSEVNGGYGAGNNIGIRKALTAGADYVLILNNDTIVKGDFLEPLVERCEQNKDVGLVSPKIYFYDRPNVIWFNGGKYDQIFGQTSHFNFNEPDVGQVSCKENSFITGCCWLVPHSIFQEVGLIREDYFMYVEDLDFSQRVLRKGYQLGVVSKSCIWHKTGTLVCGSLSDFSVYWIIKNKIKYILENNQNLWKVTALTYTIFAGTIKFLLKAKINLLISHIRGAIDGFR